MKRLFTFFAAMCVLVATSWAETCGLNQTVNTDMHIHVIVGGRTFAATLADNETSEAFVALLPLSVTMNELNGNEKYHYLSSSLPTNSYAPGTIQAGDLMLYGNNCIVLFYETFSSAYSYTRIGSIDNPSGLASALGSGNVTVRFESAATGNLSTKEHREAVQSVKVLRDGQVLVVRDGKEYNVNGQMRK